MGMIATALVTGAVVSDWRRDSIISWVKDGRQSMTQISRRDFLQRLLMVKPGISARESLQQSSCVIFRKGRLYTMNQEVSCSIPSALDTGVEGALRADKLMDLLQSLDDDEMEVGQVGKTLLLSGKNKEAKLVMEMEIVLPLEGVELPKVYQPLSPDFAEAVKLVKVCTKKKSDFALETLHMTPKFLEASDNSRIIRYSVPTFTTGEVLARADSLSSMTQLGMLEAAETENWLHFRNSLKLRVSVRKFAVQKYPDLSQFLKLRGERVVFPPAMQVAVARAGIMAEESVRVSLSNEGLTVLGQAAGGTYRETISYDKYVGPAITFSLPSKMLLEALEKSSTCEVTDCSLRVAGEKYTFVAAIERS